MTESRNSQANVNQRPASSGNGMSKASTPMASRTATSSRLITATKSHFPMKYAAAVTGVPRSRLRVPSSRSTASPMPIVMNEVDTIPYAIMLAENTWAALTPGWS